MPLVPLWNIRFSTIRTHAPVPNFWNTMIISIHKAISMIKIHNENMNAAKLMINYYRILRISVLTSVKAIIYISSMCYSLSISLLSVYRLRLVLWGWGLWTDRVYITLSQPCAADLFYNNNNNVTLISIHIDFFIENK